VKKVVIDIIVLEKQEMVQMKKCGDCVLGPVKKVPAAAILGNAFL
jgi:hypothetical protein